MIKKLLIYLTFTFSCVFSFGQSISNSVIASAGDFRTSTWGSLSATLGEAVVTPKVSATGMILLQGFQQPINSGVGISSLERGSSTVKLYPNPAQNELWIDLSIPLSTQITYRVYDMGGKEMMEGNFISRPFNSIAEQIDVGNICSGNYILILYHGQVVLQMFKLQILK